MNIIDELVDEIKKDSRYLEYCKQSYRLQQDDIQELLQHYQYLLSELNELRKYDQYIDNSSLEQELKEVRKKMSDNQIIQDYYQSYHQLNDYLNHLTQIIFNDISQDLDTTGMKI